MDQVHARLLECLKIKSQGLGQLSLSRGDQNHFDYFLFCLNSATKETASAKQGRDFGTAKSGCKYISFVNVFAVF